MNRIVGNRGLVAAAAFVGFALGARATPAAMPTTGLGSVGAQQSAADLLAQAQKFNDAGNYPAARDLFFQIQKKFPESPQAETAKELSADNAFLRVRAIERNGPSDRRVDVVVMAEGYTLDTQENFDNAAKNTLRVFFLNKTIREYRPYFNLHAMNIASKEDGVNYGKRSYDTALHGRRSEFAQGQVTVDHDAVRRFLKSSPDSEGLAIVIVKRGDLGTGGGGVAVVGGGPTNTVLHEFGHAFGGLIDEYADDVGYTGEVRTSANVSDQSDPKLVPWKHWIEAGAKGIGVYAGAAGRLKGAWKSNTGGCVMEHGEDYCRVCREQMVLSIYQRVNPIAARAPEETTVALTLKDSRDFSVTPMKPESHALKVEWWLRRLEEGEKPPEPPKANESLRQRLRGVDALEPMEGQKLAPKADPPKGTSVVTVHGAKLKEGTYVLTARVVDPTVQDGAQAWVLRDARHVLEERSVWILHLGTGLQQ